jgi:hypothetical protein
VGGISENAGDEGPSVPGRAQQPHGAIVVLHAGGLALRPPGSRSAMTR